MDRNRDYLGRENPSGIPGGVKSFDPWQRVEPKGLYLAKSIKELQKQRSVPNQKPDVLVKLSQNILTIAKECETNGDQEKAYVLFFQYCELAKTIRRSLEYKKDKLYYDSMVSSKSVKDALDHLDSLTIVLNERYEEKEKSIMKLELQNQTAQLRKKKLEIENRRQIAFWKAENDK